MRSSRHLHDAFTCVLLPSQATDITKPAIAQTWRLDVVGRLCDGKIMESSGASACLGKSWRKATHIHDDDTESTYRSPKKAATAWGATSVTRSTEVCLIRGYRLGATAGQLRVPVAARGRQAQLRSRGRRIVYSGHWAEVISASAGGC
ncbi:hypothetical protein CB1_000849040 [Camelus ferus]|nr:hypothetical protein CB1_000849040 [Camelus ferus]